MVVLTTETVEEWLRGHRDALVDMIPRLFTQSELTALASKAPHTLPPAPKQPDYDVLEKEYEAAGSGVFPMDVMTRHLTALLSTPPSACSLYFQDTEHSLLQVHTSTQLPLRRGVLGLCVRTNTAIVATDIQKVSVFP